MGEVWWTCCHGAADGTYKGCRILCHGGTDGTEKGCCSFYHGGADGTEEYEAQGLSSLNFGCTGDIHGTWWTCFLLRGCGKKMEKSFVGWHCFLLSTEVRTSAFVFGEEPFISFTAHGASIYEPGFCAASGLSWRGSRGREVRPKGITGAACEGI